jgi:nucleotide-binding universal stress UspA family protein
MFDAVVVPVDGTAGARAAVATGTAIARAAGCPLELLHVRAPLSVDTSEWWLPQLAEHIDLPEVRTIVETANSAGAAIVARIAQHPNTLTCMATHGRNRVPELILGSVASTAIAASQRPIVLVGPRCSAPASFGTIVVGVDGSALAARAAEVAATWAFELSSHLVLVAVDAPDGTSVAASSLESVAEHVRTSVGIVAERAPMLASEPAHALTNAVRTRRASLLVVGGGRTAIDAVRQVPCPVLVVPRSSGRAQSRGTRPSMTVPPP